MQQVCDLLEEAVSRFLHAADQASDLPPNTPGRAEFEVEVESRLLLTLIIRYVEGVIALAREDMVLLPGARVMTRAAFDLAVQVRWMLAPTDWFEREVRWLSRLKDEEDYYRRMVTEFQRLGADSTDWETRERLVRGFRTGVEDVLPARYKPSTPLKGLPSVRNMLRSIGDERKYLLYIMTSQYIHGTQAATSLYRRHLGTCKQLGEYISLIEWQECFQLCWFSLAISGQHYLLAIGGDPATFVSNELADEMASRLDALGRE